MDAKTTMAELAVFIGQESLKAFECQDELARRVAENAIHTVAKDNRAKFVQMSVNLAASQVLSFRAIMENWCMNEMEDAVFQDNPPKISFNKIFNW